MYSKIQLIAVAIIPLLFAITLHEAAHGWFASKFGDKTALMLGRVSLNPLRHIDLFGTIILPIVMLLLSGFIFGWAKPVPVNWANLRNPRRDMAFVALAGPGANLVMALFWALIAKICMMIFSGDVNPTLQTIARFIHFAALFGITINIFLMLLNLIPIPPLDGSRVVSSLLPPHMAMTYNRIEPYGIWILMGLLFLMIWTRSGWVFLPVRYLIGLIRALFGLG